MVMHVYDRAKEADKLDDVIIAIDSKETEEALKKQNVINEYEKKVLKIQKDEQEKRCKEILNIKNDSIDLLRKQAISDGKSWKSSIWFGGGVLTGIGITAISAWSLSKIPTAK